MLSRVGADLDVGEIDERAGVGGHDGSLCRPGGCGDDQVVWVISKAQGFEDDVEVDGGGVFGVVNEANWEVCEQSPAPGEAVTSAPRLTVAGQTVGVVPDDQSSGGTVQDPEASVPGEADVAEVLTVETSEDLAVLLAETDYCSDTVATFAAKYPGTIIEFDGSIGAMANHGSSETQFDILVGAGDFSETTSIGPAFQFRDVGMLDLHLTGPNIPDSIGVGDNIHVIAAVDEYESRSCLFLLEPVSTEIRQSGPH